MKKLIIHSVITAIIALSYVTAYGQQPCAANAHSYANSCDVRATHLDIDWSINFKTKTVGGSVIYTLEYLNPNADVLVLDTKNLRVTKVLALVGAKKNKLSYTLGAANTDKNLAFMGNALSIKLNHATKVKIYYETLPQSEALVWTNSYHGNTVNPFLFTQCEALYGRSLLPIQDAPDLKFTYTAKVKVPTDLMALMSGTDNPTQKNEAGIYNFNCKYKISSYLLALAVGDFKFRGLSPKTGIYAEPSMIDAAAAEFSDLPRMMDTTEALLGAYQWKRYDVLVVPAFFVNLGMENPMLTFASPSLVVGTKTRVGVVAHELAHSWSGNLVTHKTWDDIALTEGLTDYCESRIAEKLYGAEYPAMNNLSYYVRFQEELKTIPPAQQHLKIPLQGLNPDGDYGFSQIAYTKGNLFFLHIEQVIGRAKMDAFLKAYFKKFAWQSITVEEFIAYLNTMTTAEEQQKIGAAEYFDKPGLPKDCPSFHSSSFDALDKEYHLFQQNPQQYIAKKTYIGWTDQMWEYFVYKIYADSTTHYTAADIGQLRPLFNPRNIKIQKHYFFASLKYGNDCMAELKEYLATHGHGGTTKALYTEWATHDKAAAEHWFDSYKQRYHPVEIVAPLEAFFSKK